MLAFGCQNIKEAIDTRTSFLGAPRDIETIIWISGLAFLYCKAVFMPAATLANDPVPSSPRTLMHLIVALGATPTLVPVKKRYNNNQGDNQDIEVSNRQTPRYSRDTHKTEAEG